MPAKINSYLAEQIRAYFENKISAIELQNTISDKICDYISSGKIRGSSFIMPCGDALIGMKFGLDDFLKMIKDHKNNHINSDVALFMIDMITLHENILIEEKIGCIDNTASSITNVSDLLNWHKEIKD